MQNKTGHSNYLLVMTTLPDEASARALARGLVEQRLAACVNISPAVQSIYRWQGAIEEANEVMLLIKTTLRHYDELEAAIRHVHPYEVPEIIAVPITTGLPAYLEWIEQQTTKDDDV
jgi:periplasmic divalent cation tolerance protein